MSKQDEIMTYIRTLEPGTKISVRTVASHLGMSEGTAYRAIKESETLGVVATIPRVGTVRVEKAAGKNNDSLVFADVVKIIDGVIIGGRRGLHKKLKKLVIGAMTVDVFGKYIVQGCLTIVGNREEIQRYALENGSAVLISGGFQCSEDIKVLADEKELPIISSSYDTFTIASMINTAMEEMRLKHDIISVGEIMKEKPVYLYESDTVERWVELMRKTQHMKYPVVNSDMKAVGVITAKDMPSGDVKDEPVRKFMARDPFALTTKTAISYAANIMGSEDLDMCPVVDNRRLVGIITRKDVLKALKFASSSPNAGENIEEGIFKNFIKKECGRDMVYSGSICPSMIDNGGTSSWGVLNMLITSCAIRHIKSLRASGAPENISVIFMKPAQLDEEVTIKSSIIDMNRTSAKAEVEVRNSKNEIIAKSIMSMRILKK